MDMKTFCLFDWRLGNPLPQEILRDYVMTFSSLVELNWIARRFL